MNSTTNAIFSHRRKLQLFDFGTSNTGGTYFCKTWLKNGTPEYKGIEVITGSTEQQIYYFIPPLLVVAVTTTIYIIFKIRNYRKLKKEQKELALIGLTNFDKATLEYLDGNGTIDDQVDLLPYDQRYEFPREQLELGERIGSGAFGVVLQAKARSIYKHELTTLVAVKMVNRDVGNVYIKALASELKIMIYLGKHVNVINLLGACTKNIAERELLMIVEYCRFGNLKDYLLNLRHTFIDQINPETAQIDFAIGSTVLEVSNDTRSEDGGFNNNKICTRDLLSWSFQVAQGMEYLSSRRVVHGDLAARNILLTDENVVKICDFGLSRSIPQNDIYKKKGDEMLPVKWMAIESIMEKIFSVQSDIWSFGIVVWEIFSLGRTPYPGLEYNNNFCDKILSGYRMKAPQFAPEEIYGIMLDCWNVEPTKRPSFSQLSERVFLALDQQFREVFQFFIQSVKCVEPFKF